MTVHSVFLRVPPDDVKKHLGGFAASQFRLEIIPAHGGCVVAAIPLASHDGEGGSLVGAIHRFSLERHVLNTLEALGRLQPASRPRSTLAGGPALG